MDFTVPPPQFAIAGQSFEQAPEIVVTDVSVSYLAAVLVSNTKRTGALVGGSAGIVGPLEHTYDTFTFSDLAISSPGDFYLEFHAYKIEGDVNYHIGSLRSRKIHVSRARQGDVSTEASSRSDRPERIGLFFSLHYRLLAGGVLRVEGPSVGISCWVCLFPPGTGAYISDGRGSMTALAEEWKPLIGLFVFIIAALDDVMRFTSALGVATVLYHIHTVYKQGMNFRLQSIGLRASPSPPFDFQ
ncbi:hypothetical protein GGR52DRAFT_103479 [Hypoxylon sp. FL1284]|nr:hypothetical protein GGR52DRAFT_103479 [Hypoxylon sp. FL1284]